MNRLRLAGVVSVLTLSLLAVNLNHTALANRSNTSTALPATQQQSTAPKITSSRVKGTKLLLFGENFDGQSMVSINGRELTPKFDSSDPTLLTIKKAFKKVPPGSVATVTVQNGSGQTSEPTGIFAGLTINFTDLGKTFTIAVGEKIQLFLKQATYSYWTPDVQDTSVLTKVQDADQAAGAQGVFLGLKRGTTKLQAAGDACAPNLPIACGVPTILFEVTIVVE